MKNLAKNNFGHFCPLLNNNIYLCREITQGVFKSMRIWNQVGHLYSRTINEGKSCWIEGSGEGN